MSTRCVGMLIPSSADMAWCDGLPEFVPVFSKGEDRWGRPAFGEVGSAHLSVGSGGDVMYRAHLYGDYDFPRVTPVIVKGPGPDFKVIGALVAEAVSKPSMN